MGGAFLGLADDASAAEANPAGLTILRKSEVSVELQNYKMSQSMNVSGTFPDLKQDTFSDTSRDVEVTFASLVVPGQTFAYAIYYHQPLGYTNSASVFPQFDFFGNVTASVPNFYLPRNGTPVSLAECQRISAQDPSDPGLCQEFRLFPFGSSVSIDMKTLGVAGAWKAGNLSIGVAARYHKFEEVATTFRSDPINFNPTSIVAQATGDIKDGEFVSSEENDVTFSVGFKWVLNPKLSVGGVYKQGPQFDTATFVQNLGFDLTKIADTKFNVPDVMGIGISMRPSAAMTINLDAVNIEYSALVDDGFTSVLGVQDGYESKDITELRAGIEYFLPLKVPVAIRGGYWKEPAHALNYVGPLNESQRVAAAILFPKGEDQNHTSFGVGLAWPSFQIDAAYDSSDSFEVASVSAVFRF